MLCLGRQNEVATSLYSALLRFGICSAIGYVTPNDMLMGRQGAIHAVPLDQIHHEGAATTVYVGLKTRFGVKTATFSVWLLSRAR